MRKSKNMTIRLKIQLIFSLSILLISIAAFCCMRLISVAHERTLHRTLADYLTYSGKAMEQQLDVIDKITDNIFSNETLQQTLYSYKYTDSSSQKNVDQANIYQLLSKYSSDFSDNGISYLTILQDDTIFTSSKNQTDLLPQKFLSDLGQQAMAADGATLFITKNSSDHGLFIAKEIKRINQLDLSPLGVLLINLDLEKMINTTITINTGYEISSYVLFNDDSLMFYDQSLTAQKARALMDNYTTGYHIVHTNDDTDDNHDYFTTAGTIPNYNWKFIVTVPYDSITGTNHLVGQITIIIMILCIIFAFGTSTGLLNQLTSDLGLLVQKMRDFGTSFNRRKNYPKNYQNREDEIGLLHNTFDLMVVQIDQLIQQNYKDELQKKEAQLAANKAQIKAMESRINPHFLYNTLDSLNWRAKLVGATEISKSLVALASLLRITLNDNIQPYTIKNDIAALEYYLTIQKMRYQNRLAEKTAIPDTYLDCEIPKLTLQTLVENAIRYGLEAMSETCSIEIAASGTDTDLFITVKNNGSSFEEDLMNRLKNKQTAPHGFGIGLLNIDQRIQLNYGNDYGLTLHNEYDECTGEEYAIVTVHLPIRRTKQLQEV